MRVILQEVLQQEADFYGMDQSCMDMLAERMAEKQQEAQQLARAREAVAAAAARAASPPPPSSQPPQYRTRTEVVDLDEKAPIKHPALRGTSPQRMRIAPTRRMCVCGTAPSASGCTTGWSLAT